MRIYDGINIIVALRHVSATVKSLQMMESGLIPRTNEATMQNNNLAHSGPLAANRLAAYQLWVGVSFFVGYYYGYKLKQTRQPQPQPRSDSYRSLRKHMR
jgi:hypothetical protein